MSDGVEAGSQAGAPNPTVPPNPPSASLGQWPRPRKPVCGVKVGWSIDSVTKSPRDRGQEESNADFQKQKYCI